MSIDYKLIADDDPGGTLESAYATMSVVTVVNTKTQARYNDQDIAREIGFGPANQFLDDVEALVPPRVMYWMQNLGIDLSHLDTIAVLNSLTPEPRRLALVLALADETVPKYGIGFTIKHLNNARLSRLAGAI